MKRGTLLATLLAGTLGTAVWLAVQEGDDGGVELTTARRDPAPGAAGVAGSGSQRTGLSPRRAAPPPASAGSAANSGWPEPPAPRARQPWPDSAVFASAWASAPAPAPSAPPAALPAVPTAVRPADPAPAPVPPLLPAVATPEAPLQAPPFPYTLIGRIEDGGVAQALLAGPERTLGVKARDVIDRQWRVDSVDAASLTLTWLPGGQQQTFRFHPS